MSDTGAVRASWTSTVPNMPAMMGRGEGCRDMSKALRFSAGRRESPVSIALRARRRRIAVVQVAHRRDPRPEIAEIWRMSDHSACFVVPCSRILKIPYQREDRSWPK